jgi:hypothetical protein
MHRGSQEEAQFSGLSPVAHIVTHISTGLSLDKKNTKPGKKSRFSRLKGTES